MPRVSALTKPANDFEDGFDVDLGEAMPGEGLDELYVVGPDGELKAVDKGQRKPVAEYDHAENLADQLAESYLTKLGSEICERVAQDKTDRQPWTDRFEKGMAMIGLLTDSADDGPFPGSSTAVLPLLAEAQVQFWARALPEIFPSQGPARAKVMGNQTGPMIARGERVKEFLNYEMMFVDKGYYAETSRLISALPYQGCCFRKTFRDHVLSCTTGIFVPAEDLIVPAKATSLMTAPRYTHRMFRTPNEVRKLQVAGLFSDVSLGHPANADDDEVREIKRELDDVEADSEDPENADHELFEHYCLLDLPGYEDTFEDGTPTDIMLEYVVTVDRHSEKVLSIYRNWREHDHLKQRRIFFTKYSYLPGVGFYDFGVFHLLGGVQEAATGALRTMLDGAAMASLQGGFIAKDANIKAEQLIIEPGVWKPIESLAEDFNKSFLTPPFKEPSPVMGEVLGILTSAAQRFTSTTEMTVGDSNQGAPVGTTVALIEQGHKVYSSIHRGLHASLAEELKIRMEIDAEYMPEGGYPYDPDGTPRTVYAEDFGPGVTIEPVSDPNIFSTTQRVQIAQATLQTAEQHPDLVDRKVAVRRFLEAIKVPDIKELMSVSEDPKPMDPVSENQSFLSQKPVKAFPDQDHMAHIQVHMAFAQHPGFGGNPQVQPVIGPQLQAHIGEHLGYLYATYMRQAGVPAPMLDPITGHPGQPPVPPEAIAKMAAAVSPMLAHMPGLPQTPGPQDGQAQSQQAITNAKVQAIQQTTQAKLQGQQATQSQALQHADEQHQLDMSQSYDDHQLDAADREHQLMTSSAQSNIETQHQAIGAQIEQTNMQTAAANEQVSVASDAKQAQISAADRTHEFAVDAADRTHKLVTDTASRVAKVQEAQAKAQKAKKDAQAPAKPNPGNPQ